MVLAGNMRLGGKFWGGGAETQRDAEGVFGGRFLFGFG